MKNDNTIPALDKALRLLEYLGKKDGGASQPELIRRLGLSPSTCYRIVQTFLKYDWVRPVPGNKYDLSNGAFFVLKKLSEKSVRFEAVQPILEKLTEETMLSSKLSIRQGSEQVTLLRAESSQPMTVTGRVGSRFPLIEGSVGAALLLDADFSEIQTLASECREELAEKSNPQIIADRFQVIRAKGYCLNTKYNRWNVDAMSAPIRDYHGKIVAAVTLLGFDEDFKGSRLDKTVYSLLKAVFQIEKLI